MGLLRCLVLSALVAGTGCRQVLGLDDVDCTPAYAAPVDYATAAGPRAVGVGDLSGDGRADLVTANTGNANVSRFDGVGDGTVMPKTDHEAIAAPVDMVVGDLTGDDLADVAVLGNNNGLVVLRSAGGTIAIDQEYNVDNGRDLEIGDLDGNGVLDLVGTSNGTTFPTVAAKLTVLLARNDTLEPTEYEAPDNPNVIRIADFTSDGRLDVLLTSNSEMPTVIRPGTGGGALGEPIDTGLTLTTSFIVVGDVNDDGRPDLVVTNNDASAVTTSVLLGNGDGTFATGTATAAEILPTALADVDSDGHLDIVGIAGAKPDQNEGMASIGVQLGAGDGTFGAVATTLLSGAPVDAIAARLDDDSIPELIAVLGTTNNIAIIDGRCSFASE